MPRHEFIFGIHAVEKLMMAAPGRVASLLVARNRQNQRLRALLSEAGRRGVPVQLCEREELDKTVAGAHQGVVAAVSPASGLSERELQSELSESRVPPLLLVLDGVQDPHNLGACLRSADGAGAQAVIVPKDKAVGLTGTVRKVASGAAEFTPLVRVTNLARTLRWLKEAGVWLVGTGDDAEGTLYEVDLTAPVALVMGGEGRGLRRLTRKHCDYVVSLPMHGAVESLNVSVAAGICLYEAVRQRAALSK